MHLPAGTSVELPLWFVGALEDATTAALFSGVTDVGSGGVREHAAPATRSISPETAKNPKMRRLPMVRATLSGLVLERPFFFDTRRPSGQRALKGQNENGTT